MVSNYTYQNNNSYLYNKIMNPLYNVPEFPEYDKVKPEHVKPNPNSRIIDLNSDKGFTTNPPSRISIKYTQKRLANRRKRLIQRRSRPRNHIKIKK